MCVAICGETVIHSERFVMKEDLEGMHFNGEGRGVVVEMKAADHHLSLLLPPFTNIDCAAVLN